jgi:hypothetical protein
MSLEDTLSRWATGPSDAEREKADNAERVIREALQADEALAKHDIRVLLQGSYKANTNVRLDSDVDICVLCTEVFYYDLAFSDLTPSEVPGTAPTLSYPDFKNMVQTALVSRFGRPGVTRGNKAFDVHANTYRVDADVLVAFEHRRFSKRGPRGEINWETGIQFFSDDGKKVVNWPQQAYENGVAKNNRTGRNYKASIRILKRLRNQMQENHVPEAGNIASSLIESLMWNVPDASFVRDTYQQIVRGALANSFNDTITDETCSEWGEVNELKYVFRLGQPWTRQQAHSFLSASWDYLGYK